MSMNRRAAGQKGFTIVELMVASTVFASVLLLITYAVLQIGRTYYKGITTSRTQEVARSVIDEVSRSVQFGSGIPNISSGMVCAGGKRFSYVLDQQVSDSPEQHALRVEDVDSCEGQTPDMNEGRELLATRMRLMTFDASHVGGDLYRITVRVVSGDDDTLTPDRMSCASQRTGTEYCAVSELSTVVQKRAR